MDGLGFIQVFLCPQKHEPKPEYRTMRLKQQLQNPGANQNWGMNQCDSVNTRRQTKY